MNRTRPMSVPSADLLPTPVRKVVTEYDALVAKQATAAAELHRLENCRRAATAADRDAHAAALRQGKADPGTPATAEHDTAMAEQRRLVEAYGKAVEDVGLEVTAAIDTARPAWTTRIGKDVTRARARYQQAVTELEAARVALVELQSTAAWLAEPERHTVFKVVSPPVRLLRSQSGDPQAWEAVAHALRGEFPETPTAMPTPLPSPAQLLADADQATGALAGTDLPALPAW